MLFQTACGSVSASCMVRFQIFFVCSSEVRREGFQSEPQRVLQVEANTLLRERRIASSKGLQDPDVLFERSEAVGRARHGHAETAEQLHLVAHAVHDLDETGVSAAVYPHVVEGLPELL